MAAQRSFYVACWTLYAVGLVILARMPRHSLARLLTGLAAAFGVAAALAPWLTEGRIVYDMLRGPLFLVACAGAWWAAKRGEDRGGAVLEAIAVGCFAVLATWAILRVFPLGNVTGEEAGSQLARAFSPAAVWVQALLPLTWLVARLHGMRRGSP